MCFVLSVLSPLSQMEEKTSKDEDDDDDADGDGLSIYTCT